MKPVSHYLKVAGFAAVLCFAQPVSAETSFLSPAQFDPSQLLPPPPADGSTAQAAELAELHRIEDGRTSDALARAEADSKNETINMFAEILGPSFDIAKFPATAKLFSKIAIDEDAISGEFKTYFHRNRPYAVDPTLKHCGQKSSKGVQTSYPSGHSTVAYAMGAVLAQLMPDHAQQILSRSADFAENRLVCGVHYRSDIEAGHVLGMLMAAKMKESGDFRSEYEASNAELHAAGLSR